MSKTHKRDRSSLTNDQYLKMKEADSILSRMLIELDIMEKGLETGVLSQSEILETLNTRMKDEFDKYNELVHDVELDQGMSIYALGFRHTRSKEIQVLERTRDLL